MITQRAKALSLREKGWSYNLISEQLGVPKSTLSYWLRAIPYTPSQLVLKRIRDGSKKSVDYKRNNKKQSLELASRLAIEDVGKLNTRDLFILGLGIYIGEGSKSNETVRIVNSDPWVIKTGVKWLTQVCKVPIENLVISIHGYPDTDLAEATRFWAEVTGIPPHQFMKPQIDARLGKSTIKKGRSPFGTAHLQVKACGSKELGVFLHRRIMGWINTAYKQVNAGII